jgi:hypothetical protein
MEKIMNRFKQYGKASRATVITLASFAILISMAILFLPSGFSNDVSKIGKGSKVVVFAYNNGTTNSMSMMNFLDKIRSSYTDNLEFLAVSISAPIGKKFLKDYNVEQSTLVFFRKDGSIASTLHASKDNELLLPKILDKFAQE